MIDRGIVSYSLLHIYLARAGILTNRDTVQCDASKATDDATAIQVISTGAIRYDQYSGTTEDTFDDEREG